MPKKATKAANNVFYQARVKASSYNDRLALRDGASEETGIDRNRIAYTELGTLCPYPEEVLVYADIYSSPELLNYYCSTLCPIGRETVEPIVCGSLEQMSLRLLASTRCISEIREQLIDIAEDGRIDDAEKSKMDEILQALKQASNDVKALEIAYKKMLRG